MTVKRPLVVSALGGAILSFAATARPECVPLRPPVGPLVSPYLNDYYTALYRSFFGGETLPIELEMVELPAYANEEAVYIVDVKAGTVEPPQYVVISVVAKERISSPLSQSTDAVPVRTWRAPISVDAVKKLRDLWQQVVDGTRNRPMNELSGAVYYFSTAVREGYWGTGETWVPTPDNCAIDLVRIGQRLTAYARAPVRERRNILADILRRIEAFSAKLHPPAPVK
jgi:hypothetical protein